LVARAAGLDLLDVGVGALLLGGEILDADPQVADAVLGLGTAQDDVLELVGLRERPELVRQGVDPGVELLDVEERELDVRVGFQGVLLPWTLRPGRSRGRC
jgi:hypothetical protein